MLKALPTSGTIGSGERRPAAVDDLKEVKERARLAALHGEENTSKMVARLVKGTWLSIEEEKYELKKEKIELEKKLARARTDALKEAKQLDALKASHAVAIYQLQVEARVNLDEMVEVRGRLGRHLMLKGYSEVEVKTVKADTYVEEGDDDEVEVVGVVDGLDGVSHLTVFDNQGDDTEHPEGDNEKALREMSLKLKDLESGHAREKKISTALLSAQAELQIELDSARSREDDVLEYNREFADELDRMREANENREDQHIKVHFKLVEVTQAVFDLNHKVEEKDAEIGKGLKELAEMTEDAAKLQSQVDALMVKSLPAKDMEFQEMQQRCNDLNEWVARLKTVLEQATVRAKKAEARERPGGSRNEVNAHLV
ncbi:hypothetical protein GIB67_027532 [Kingdonia uniflora]|uniref:Uncharacterized protein n=1 Tax=Kingdonia uniflora TaxID=39325 RepID=A0A7J7NLA6_9MAGN|nr:hypothetical protein GIB67_027532 [Kingdonia uniflora]